MWGEQHCCLSGLSQCPQYNHEDRRPADLTQPSWFLLDPGGSVCGASAAPCWRNTAAANQLELFIVSSQGDQDQDQDQDHWGRCLS
ncbi:hypothetical protein D4764_04G0000360 [Takifugu flavidus]|uniref:Uncharacterized protein n=1 Tax=Takifugu flavidus TaxID=433684 RepID=A0A5C6N6G8_9TELE|nr:hypothetical protein D4764_04G0000360 [Takifugu flavidus]